MFIIFFTSYAFLLSLSPFSKLNNIQSVVLRKNKKQNSVVSCLDQPFYQSLLFDVGEKKKNCFLNQKEKASVRLSFQAGQIEKGEVHFNSLYTYANKLYFEDYNIQRVRDVLSPLFDPSCVDLYGQYEKFFPFSETSPIQTEVFNQSVNPIRQSIKEIIANALDAMGESIGQFGRGGKQDIALLEETGDVLTRWSKARDSSTVLEYRIRIVEGELFVKIQRHLFSNPLVNKEWKGILDSSFASGTIWKIQKKSKTLKESDIYQAVFDSFPLCLESSVSLNRRLKKEVLYTTDGQKLSLNSRSTVRIEMGRCFEGKTNWVRVIDQGRGMSLDSLLTYYISACGSDKKCAGCVPHVKANYDIVQTYCFPHLVVLCSNGMKVLSMKTCHPQLKGEPLRKIYVELGSLRSLRESRDVNSLELRGEVVDILKTLWLQEFSQNDNLGSRKKLLYINLFYHCFEAYFCQTETEKFQLKKLSLFFKEEAEKIAQKEDLLLVSEKWKYTTANWKDHFILFFHPSLVDDKNRRRVHDILCVETIGELRCEAKDSVIPIFLGEFSSTHLPLPSSDVIDRDDICSDIFIDEKGLYLSSRYRKVFEEGPPLEIVYILENLIQEEGFKGRLYFFKKSPSSYNGSSFLKKGVSTLKEKMKKGDETLFSILDQIVLPDFNLVDGTARLMKFMPSQIVVQEVLPNGVYVIYDMDRFRAQNPFFQQIRQYDALYQDTGQWITILSFSNEGQTLLYRMKDDSSLWVYFVLENRSQVLKVDPLVAQKKSIIFLSEGGLDSRLIYNKGESRGECLLTLNQALLGYNCEDFLLSCGYREAFMNDGTPIIFVTIEGENQEKSINEETSSALVSRYWCGKVSDIPYYKTQGFFFETADFISYDHWVFLDGQWIMSVDEFIEKKGKRPFQEVSQESSFFVYKYDSIPFFKLSLKKYSEGEDKLKIYLREEDLVSFSGSLKSIFDSRFGDLQKNFMSQLTVRQHYAHPYLFHVFFKEDGQGDLLSYASLMQIYEGHSTLLKRLPYFDFVGRTHVLFKSKGLVVPLSLMASSEFKMDDYQDFFTYSQVSFWSDLMCIYNQESGSENVVYKVVYLPQLQGEVFDSKLYTEFVSFNSSVSSYLFSPDVRNHCVGYSLDIFVGVTLIDGEYRVVIDRYENVGRAGYTPSHTYAFPFCFRSEYIRFNKVLDFGYCLSEDQQLLTYSIPNGDSQEYQFNIKGLSGSYLSIHRNFERKNWVRSYQNFSRDKSDVVETFNYLELSRHLQKEEGISLQIIEDLLSPLFVNETIQSAFEYSLWVSLIRLGEVKKWNGLICMRWLLERKNQMQSLSFCYEVPMDLLLNYFQNYLLGDYDSFFIRQGICEEDSFFMQCYLWQGRQLTVQQLKDLLWIKNAFQMKLSNHSDLFDIFRILNFSNFELEFMIQQMKLILEKEELLLKFIISLNQQLSNEEGRLAWSQFLLNPQLNLIHSFCNEDLSSFLYFILDNQSQLESYEVEKKENHFRTLSMSEIRSLYQIRINKDGIVPSLPKEWFFLQNDQGNPHCFVGNIKYDREIDSEMSSQRAEGDHRIEFVQNAIDGQASHIWFSYYIEYFLGEGFYFVEEMRDDSVGFDSWFDILISKRTSKINCADMHGFLGWGSLTYWQNCRYLQLRRYRGDFCEILWFEKKEVNGESFFYLTRLESSKNTSDMRQGVVATRYLEEVNENFFNLKYQQSIGCLKRVLGGVSCETAEILYSSKRWSKDNDFLGVNQVRKIQETDSFLFPHVTIGQMPKKSHFSCVRVLDRAGFFVLFASIDHPFFQLIYPHLRKRMFDDGLVFYVGYPLIRDRSQFANEEKNLRRIQIEIALSFYSYLCRKILDDPLELVGYPFLKNGFTTESQERLQLLVKEYENIDDLYEYLKKLVGLSFEDFMLFLCVFKIRDENSLSFDTIKKRYFKPQSSVDNIFHIASLSQKNQQDSKDFTFLLIRPFFELFKIDSIDYLDGTVFRDMGLFVSSSLGEEVASEFGFFSKEHFEEEVRSYQRLILVYELRFKQYLETRLDARFLVAPYQEKLKKEYQFLSELVDTDLSFDQCIEKYSFLNRDYYKKLRESLRSYLLFKNNLKLSKEGQEKVWILNQQLLSQREKLPYYLADSLSHIFLGEWLKEKECFHVLHSYQYNCDVLGVEEHQKLRRYILYYFLKESLTEEHQKNSFLLEKKHQLNLESFVQENKEVSFVCQPIQSLSKDCLILRLA